MLYFAATSATAGTVNVTVNTTGGFLYATATLNLKTGAVTDGKVTGGNRHYKGSINLYRQSGGTAGQCDPKVGVAQIAITVAANGATASVNLVGNDCATCKPQTWTRQS